MVGPFEEGICSEKMGYSSQLTAVHLRLPVIHPDSDRHAAYRVVMPVNDAYSGWYGLVYGIWANSDDKKFLYFSNG